MEDRELVLRARDGDRAAFAQLVGRHQQALRRLCLSLLGNPAEADDAAQEVFLKAFRSLSEFRGEARFSSWLYRVASNHCLDLLRRRARAGTLSWDELLEKDGARVAALLQEPDAAAAAEARDLVGRVLGLLSPEYRLVLTLRELQGLSYEEIAEATGASLDSVKARLKRARAELEQRLRHFFGTGNV